MKISHALLAVVFIAAVFAEETTQPNNAQTSGLYKLKTSSDNVLTVEATNPKVIWTNVLTVSGLTIEAAQQTLGGISALYSEVTQRPKKPEEITVLLYTADGKCWRAKWVADSANQP